MENLQSGTVTTLAGIEGRTELPQQSLDYETFSPVPIKVRMGIQPGTFQSIGQLYKDTLRRICHGDISPAMEEFNAHWEENKSMMMEQATRLALNS